MLLARPSSRIALRASTCGPTSKLKILELIRKDNPMVSDDLTSNKLKLVPKEARVFSEIFVNACQVLCIVA